MRDSSNTFIYIVGGIILLHFLVGFIWLIVKFSKKKDE
jgi:ABC-type glycerol-3-phosphate transport system permease component